MKKPLDKPRKKNLSDKKLNAREIIEAIAWDVTRKLKKRKR